MAIVQITTDRNTADQITADRKSVELHLADLQAIVEQLADRGKAKFGRRMAGWGVLPAEAGLAWLDETEPVLAPQSDIAAGTGGSAIGWEVNR